MCKYINKLKGSEKKENNTIRIFGEDGHELEKCKMKEEIENFWSTVYRKHESNTSEVWNNERKEEYEKDYEEMKKKIQEGKEVFFQRPKKREETDDI